MIDFFESLTTWILANLAFFASGLGLLIIGATAVLIILLWDWRVTLCGLVIIQSGVIVLVVKVYQLPLMWSNVQLLVSTFAAGMLALSARQITTALYLHRPGSWLVRLCAVILLIVGWQFVEVEVTIPLLTPQITQLFLWLTVCSFVLMGLSDSPLHIGVALLFWFIPIQVLVEILLPGYGLFVQIGIVELFVALTCSYLLLAQHKPQQVVQRVLTDVTFPIDVGTEFHLPRPKWAPRLENRLTATSSSGQRSGSIAPPPPLVRAAPPSGTAPRLSRAVGLPTGDNGTQPNHEEAAATQTKTDGSNDTPMTGHSPQ